MSKFLVTPLIPICDKCKKISMINVKLVILSFRNRIKVKFVLQCFSTKTYLTFSNNLLPSKDLLIDGTLPRIVSFENTR